MTHDLDITAIHNCVPDFSFFYPELEEVMQSYWVGLPSERHQQRVQHPVGVIVDRHPAKSPHPFLC